MGIALCDVTCPSIAPGHLLMEVIHFAGPPILAFLDLLAFFVLWFSLFFCAFLLSFPRISRVLQRGNPCFFSGDPRFVGAKKKKKQGLEGQGNDLHRVRKQIPGVMSTVSLSETGEA